MKGGGEEFPLPHPCCNAVVTACRLSGPCQLSPPVALSAWPCYCLRSIMERGGGSSRDVCHKPANPQNRTTSANGGGGRRGALLSLKHNAWVSCCPLPNVRKIEKTSFFKNLLLLFHLFKFFTQFLSWLSSNWTFSPAIGPPQNPNVRKIDKIIFLL